MKYEVEPPNPATLIVSIVPWVDEPAPDAAPLTVDQRRSRRRRAVRARSFGSYGKRHLAMAVAADRASDLPHRPATRAECLDAPRPCPFVSCAHHLYLEATSVGSVRLRFPDLEPWELEESCALDVADHGATTAEAVAVLLNLTRERIRQIEASALEKLRAVAPPLEE